MPDSVESNHLKHIEHNPESYAPIISQALTIRFTEERLLELFSQGKLFGTIHTCIGQEFVGVSVARCLKPHDFIFSNHRCHGHFIARNNNLDGLIAEIMGKSTGVCGGIGGSQHLHQDRFFSNGIQGGIVPVAAGLAMAQKRDAAGGIAVVYIGDGTLGEGVLYEALNIASKWELPLLVVLENNFYAQSTHQSQTIAGDIDARFRALNINTFTSDTGEWENLLTQMETSVRYVRENGKPAFHRVDTYRLMAHSKGDDNRLKEEVDSFRNRDPLSQIISHFSGTKWFQSITAEIKNRLDTAVETADKAHFAELEIPSAQKNATKWEILEFSRERINSSLRKALNSALENDPKVVLIGEDIESPYGGAFKATDGLSATFPDRVLNTPISEAAITGIANGLALGGYRPVVEIMFGDFLTLAVDQWLNHAAKFAQIYNNKIKVPIVIRTPMGGKRGYGPTHSQSIEKLFLGVPGTRVLCMNHRYSPELLYKNLFALPDLPTLVVENKILYGQYAHSESPAGYQLFSSTGDAFPMIRLKPDDDAEITIVAIGGAAMDAEAAAQELFIEEEALADLFFPLQLYPFDISAIMASVNTTKRLLIVEEGQGFASLSSEILAQISEQRALTGVVCGRVCALPYAIPSSRYLEEKCLPTVDKIVQKAKELLYG